jgi:starvation-inducible outer membrane lipoprotein
MKTPKGIIISMYVLMFLVSCAGAPKVPFKTMVQEADSRVGEDVILGGYILDSHMSGYKMDIKTNITVLQTPLEWNTKPLTKDKSEGSFFAIYAGEFDAQDYEPEDRITVHGTIVGLAGGEIKSCSHPCLKVESSKIRMWREHQHFYRPSGGPGF